MASEVRVRDANRGDCGAILKLIQGLADYENLSNKVISTEADLETALFSPQPRVYCDIAEVGGVAAGCAVWFYNFSGFRGRHGLYLEDLFVEQRFRRLGVGEALLRRLGARCVAENLAFFQWLVADWNLPAIDFYKSLGAEEMDGWRIMRVSGPALAVLGKERDVEPGVSS